MRPAWILSLLSVALVGAGCDRNCAVGNPRDALVDRQHDGSPREASVDGRPRVDGRGADRAPVVGWVATAGGADTHFASEMVVDGSDSIIIAGRIAKTATFGSISVASTKDQGLFVAKLDPSGKFLWAVPLAGDASGGLAVDGAGNIFCAGAFTETASFGSTTLTSKGDRDGFLAKLDPSGKLLWAKAVVAGPGWDAVYGLAVGSDGLITVGGSFKGTTTIDGTSLAAKGKSDLFVARLDAAGDLLWVTQAGSDDAGLDDGVGGVVVDGSGNSFVAGWAGPNTSFGVYDLVGTTGSTSAFVAKVDPSGKFAWATSVQGGFANGPLKLDATGDLFVATAYLVPWSGVGHPMISKLDAKYGNVLWTRPIAGDRRTEILGLLVGSAGSVTFAGVFTGTAYFGSAVLQSKSPGPTIQDGFIARLDPSGAVVHAEQLHSVELGASHGAMEVTRLARDRAANVYVSGGFSGSIVLGGTTLSKAGILPDIFVWNRGPDPL